MLADGSTSSGPAQGGRGGATSRNQCLEEWAHGEKANGVDSELISVGVAHDCGLGGQLRVFLGEFARAEEGNNSTDVGGGRGARRRGDLNIGFVSSQPVEPGLVLAVLNCTSC
jgi:hypothetical protein